MKKKAFVAILAVLMLSVTVTAQADRYQRNTSDSPYRLIGYVAHPVGVALEYGVMRPVHWLVSRPHLDVIFGHKSHVEDEGTYFEWVHGDFEPSIAEEWQKRQPMKKLEQKQAKVKTMEEAEEAEAEEKEMEKAERTGPTEKESEPEVQDAEEKESN